MAANTEKTSTNYPDLIATLTLPEKVTLLTGAAVFTRPGTLASVSRR